jgi:hypothetical protein
MARSDTTPLVLGAIDGHIPAAIAGDAVETNQARYRRWFITGFEGAGAVTMYMATCAAQGIIETTSFTPEQLAKYNDIMADSNYFKQWQIVMCPEQAPTTGRWHVHAAIISPTVISRKAIQKIFPGWDCRPMRGTPKQARDYVIKCGAMAVYVHDPAIWDEEEKPLVRQPPIDWAHVIACCNRCRTFRQFKREYIDAMDPDCLRAAVSKVNFIKELISANSPPRRHVTHLLTLWQRALVTACLDNPVASHRKIYWVWSPESGTGKSSVSDGPKAA